MMKKIYNWLLMGALVCGLSATVTSCKDDDDKNTSEQRNEDADPLDTDEAQTAWRWLSALTNAETLDNNWGSKTYEPTVGEPSENNANTRIVVVANLDEAQTKFASLAGVNANSLGTEMTVSQGGVGKLTWMPSKAGAQNLAEVAVDTKLIPHLQKIIYCTEEQVGSNGVFYTNVDGTAYYRLGDVVKDNDGYYWVCVRPSFKQHDKGKSYWMNIFNASESGKNPSGFTMPIPQENIYDKYDKKYDGKTILLPTKLKYSREHMNNLANLIFALVDPGKYATKVGTDIEYHNNGLCGFDYKYHGEKFLTRVANNWETRTSNGYTVWEMLFNRTHQQMQDSLKSLRFIYQGYQWRVGRTGYVWEFKADRANGFQAKAPGSESDDKKLYPFADNGYDIRRYSGYKSAAKSNAEMEPQFSSTTYTWVVRYKTGEDLMVNGKYSPYEKLNGCVDMYRYNDVTGQDVHSDPETETTMTINNQQLEKPVVGAVIGDDGLFYANARGIKPVAIVVHYGEPGSVEEGTQYRGLAIAVDYIREAGDNFIDYLMGDYRDCPVPKIPREQYISAQNNGLQCTKTLVDGCGKGHNHPAAKGVNDYGLLAANIRQAKGFSNWFLPSSSQVLMAMQGIGLKGLADDHKKFVGTEDEQADIFRAFFENRGLDMNYYSNMNKDILTSTFWESDKQQEVVILEMGNGMYYSYLWVVNPGIILPFIAF